MGILDDLTLLVEIIKAGGISAASRVNGISKASLSRRVAQLENELGVSLLTRGPRNFSATEMGLLICERGERIKDELEAIKALVENAANRPSGALRISCPTVLTERLVADYACQFAAEYPEVRLTLNTSVGTFEPMLGQNDLSIYPAMDVMADSELVRQKLYSAAYRLVASPSLLSSLGSIKSPDDLNQCDGIGWVVDGFLSRWNLIGCRGETAEVTLALRFNANNLNVIRSAALAGLGLARLPFMMCEADLSAGNLVMPLLDWSPPPITIYALYPSRRGLTLAGRLFLAGLGRHVRETMWNQPTFADTD
jgi:DNA-binding transcriptional LysR family regulator